MAVYNWHFTQILILYYTTHCTNTTEETHTNSPIKRFQSYSKMEIRSFVRTFKCEFIFFSSRKFHRKTLNLCAYFMRIVTRSRQQHMLQLFVSHTYTNDLLGDPLRILSKRQQQSWWWWWFLLHCIPDRTISHV